LKRGSRIVNSLGSVKCADGLDLHRARAADRFLAASRLGRRRDVTTTFRGTLRDRLRSNMEATPRAKLSVSGARERLPRSASVSACEIRRGLAFCAQRMPHITAELLMTAALFPGSSRAR